MAERPRQRRPVNLTQEPGVRLALALRALRLLLAAE